jgi:hypothetical protein
MIMSLMGFGTKNYYAGEGQQQFTIQLESTDFLEEYVTSKDSLCGPLVRVPGYRSRGTGFDSRRYQIF